jgi:hypothetical protein
MADERIEALSKSTACIFGLLSHMCSSAHHVLISVPGQGPGEGWIPNGLDTIPAFPAAAIWLAAKAQCNLSQCSW